MKKNMAKKYWVAVSHKISFPTMETENHADDHACALAQLSTTTTAEAAPQRTAESSTSSRPHAHTKAADASV